MPVLVSSCIYADRLEKWKKVMLIAIHKFVLCCRYFSGPRPHECRYFWKLIFFSVLAFRPQVNGVLRHQNAGFQKHSPRWRFLKTLASRCHTSYSACPVTVQSHFHRFSVFVWTGENDSNTILSNAFFLKTKKKNQRFQNYPCLIYTRTLPQTSRVFTDYFWLPHCNNVKVVKWHLLFP